MKNFKEIKKELAQMAEENLLDVWVAYQKEKGIESGDISPEDLLTYHEKLEDLVTFIIKTCNQNLPYNEKLAKKLMEFFESGDIQYEHVGSRFGNDCINFVSDVFEEKNFHMYIPSMAWDNIEEFFVEKIIDAINIGELTLKEDF